MAEARYDAVADFSEAGLQDSYDDPVSVELLDVCGAWPTGGSYYREGHRTADGARSTLRGRVGADHRMRSTYVRSLVRHGLVPADLREPAPAPDWAGTAPEAARPPVFLVVACTRAPAGGLR